MDTRYAPTHCGPLRADPLWTYYDIEGSRLKDNTPHDVFMYY